MAAQRKRELHFTDGAIRKLEPEAKLVRWKDAVQPGLICAVSPNGKKRFKVRYVTADGKQGEPTIGEFPSVNTARARESAQKMLSDVRLSGSDPVEQRRQQKAEGKSKRERTLAKLIDLYLADVERRGEKRESTISKERTHLNANIKPRLGHRAVSSLKRADIKEALYEIRDSAAKRSGKSGASAANDCRKYLSQVIAHGVELEWLEGNLVRDIKKFEESNRTRTATAEEIKALWQRWETRKRGGRKSGWSGAAALQFELLTLQRGEEVVSMLWDEIDFENKRWNIPGGRKKEARGAVVPLGEHAMAILEEAKQRALRDAFKRREGTAPPDNEILEGEPETPGPFTGYGGELLKRNSSTQTFRRDCVDLEIADLTPHDMRRTGRTAITDGERLGFPPHVGEAVLNHQTGSKLQRVYDRNTYVREKRDALAAWERHVLTLVGEVRPEHDNVVDLARHA